MKYSELTNGLIAGKAYAIQNENGNLGPALLVRGGKLSFVEIPSKDPVAIFIDNIALPELRLNQAEIESDQWIEVTFTMLQALKAQ